MKVTTIIPETQVGIIDASIIVSEIGNNTVVWTLDEKMKKILKREYINL